MVEKPQKQNAILIGAAVIAGISALPGISIINCFCCAGILFGGALAVFFYQKDFRPEMPLMETSDALVVGLLSGIFGAIGATILSGLFLLVLGPFETEFIRDLIEKFAENGTIPYDIADQILEAMDESMAEAASLAGLLTGFFFNIIIFPIFGMLGGLIGYGLFRKKDVPQVRA